MLRSHEIYEAAIELGTLRLRKGAYATAISALIGGMYATLGGVISLTIVALMLQFTGSQPFAWFCGSLAYPISYLFVVLGKSELFSENFLHPVLAVWEKNLAHKSIIRLWGVGFLFNMIGVGLMTGLIWFSDLLGSHNLLGPQIIDQFIRMAETTMDEPFWPFIWKAIFAGLFLNLMSWLILACEQDISRFIVIWLTTSPIMLLQTHHSVVGSSEILLGIFHGADVSTLQWAYGFLIPVAIGNHIGGVMFVTSLHFLQQFIHRRDWPDAE